MIMQKNYLSVDPMDKNNTKKQNNVKDIRTRILKSFLLFMMDVLFAAGILGAYYYFTYRAPKDPVEGKKIAIDFGDDTASQTTAFVPVTYPPMTDPIDPESKQASSEKQTEVVIVTPTETKPEETAKIDPAETESGDASENGTEPDTEPVPDTKEPSIQIVATPEKINASVKGTHYVGDNLTGADFVVEVTMSDGSVLANPEGFTAAPLALSQENTQITVSYGGLSTVIVAEAKKKPSDTPIPGKAGSWREKFASYFTSEPVLVPGKSYSDSNINIQISDISLGSGEETIRYLVADIHVADIRYFGTGLVNGDTTFRATSPVSYYYKINPAYYLITNGDYCGYHSQGIIIRNGVIYRQEPTSEDQCVLYADGRMVTYGPGEFTVDMAVNGGAWQAWCFGPSLLDSEGRAKDNFNTNYYITKLHPRTAIGYYEPGHYCMVVVNGRETGYSRGVTTKELANIFQDLGCKVAYNLDGGGSSTMSFVGQQLNHSADRYVSDFVVVSALPLG